MDNYSSQSYERKERPQWNSDRALLLDSTQRERPGRVESGACRGTPAGSDPSLFSRSLGGPARRPGFPTAGAFSSPACRLAALCHFINPSQS
ncbi:hypothetical protein SKAU_G00318760 [Synaphobranchus kaupii]|uniref:Uncharacterized protein n=1 Tax=Synaphobranchus kaupii TaxID=118154 RepID=A0A9Q1IM03_SYNKA|nr:hypothetical protein SKAU_G00318760 [Synaphobranchus kaupii]